MKRALVLSVLMLSACSSSTSPATSLSGHWVASFQVDTTGAPTIIWQGGLTQSGDAISGSVLCGATVAAYTVTGQVVHAEPINTGLNLTLIGAGGDTARLFGAVRDSANYGVIASGTSVDHAAGQCLSGYGFWSARQLSSP